MIQKYRTPRASDTHINCDSCREWFKPSAVRYTVIDGDLGLTCRPCGRKIDDGVEDIFPER